MLRCAHILCITGILGMAFPAFAQEDTSSGTILITESGALLEEQSLISSGTILLRLKRLKVLTAKEDIEVSSTQDIEPPTEEMQRYNMERERFNERREDFRKNCLLDIRQANRDTRDANIMRCFRGHIMQDVSAARYWVNYLASDPFASPLLKAQAIANGEELIEAILTVINGVDAGVYTSPDSLAETKRLLREQYRKAYWVSRIQMRTERALGWVQLMSIRLITLAEGDVEWTPKLLAAFDKAISCEEKTVPVLQGILEEDDPNMYSEIKDILSQFFMSQQECNQLFETLLKIYQMENLSEEGS